MLSHFIQVQYCYDYLVNQISMGLLLYSHLPVALTALAFSAYVLLKARNLSSLLLFGTCFTFTIWCGFDLSAWFSLLGSANTMFVWSLLDFLAVSMFFLAYYFLYTFTTGRDLPLWQKILGLLLMLPTIYVTVLGLNIPTYDLNSCAALEDGSFTIYTYYAEALFILATLIFVIVQYRCSKEKDKKNRTLLSGIGVLIFLAFFFSASFSVSLFAATDASLYVYNYLIYGLFGMPIFLIYLGFLIVRYHAFDLRVFAAQALSIVVVTLVATQYAFLSGTSSIILNSVNLIFVAIVSIYLTRNVKKEISLRAELATANKQLENLVHFVSHEVKGALGKNRIIFNEIGENVDGAISSEMSDLARQADSDTKKTVEMVMDILNSSDLQSGKVLMIMNHFDMRDAVLEAMKDAQKEAQVKGISLETNIRDNVDWNIMGDREKIVQHVVRNLIENSIKYTPKGGLTVSLTRNDDKIFFSVKDTGVGLSENDKKVLFTEGGKGENSTKINVHSTGYGLFYAKSIVEAHKGRIWAESDGQGKGSTFFVELPVV